jgi:hypothetical protein
MVDVSAIAGTVSALKGAMDITKAMIGLRDAQAIQAKVIELNAAILDAQSSALTANEERSTLIERVRNLEKQVADFEAWETEKQRYELKDIGLGSLAYVVKETMRGTEPSHQICAACYQHHKKSILQPKSHGVMKQLFCPDCKTEFNIFVNMDPTWGIT